MGGEMVTDPQPNFIETRCNDQNTIEGSDRRFENGNEVNGDPLPCLVPGEKFLRIDPITEPMQLSADQPRNPDINQGKTTVTTDYTYFFMAREVSYRRYEERCSDTIGMDEATRLEQATCLSPTALTEATTLPELCSSRKQNEFDISPSGQSASGDNQDLPMNCVDWESAANYCRRIGGRLPSEAEWEIAATYGRTIFPVPWPEDLPKLDVCEYANRAVEIQSSDECQASNPTYLDEAGTPQALDIRPTCWGESNPWAERESIICDAVGNVAEWTLDDYEEEFSTDPSSGEPILETPAPSPTITTCPNGVTWKKVLKGGHAKLGDTAAEQPSVSLFAREQSNCAADELSPYHGFRCVISTKTHGVPYWSE